MINNKSLARELSLIALGLINDKDNLDLDQRQIEEIVDAALDSLINHCREELDNSEADLENASQSLLESELKEDSTSSLEKVRDEIKKAFYKIETVMNSLSVILDFPKLIVAGNQSDIRADVNHKISSTLKNIRKIDSVIDDVMDGWRLKRLPRIDRDILRLAYVDIYFLNTPIAVACDEAVNLANKYSDTQGRKMINGVLRRLQTVKAS